MGPLLLNGLLLFKMFAHGRLDLAGGVRLVTSNSHTGNVTGLDGVSCDRICHDCLFRIKCEKFVVILGVSDEFPERLRVVVIDPFGILVLNLVHDHLFRRKIERHRVDVVIIEVNSLHVGKSPDTGLEIPERLDGSVLSLCLVDKLLHVRLDICLSVTHYNYKILSSCPLGRLRKHVQVH